MRNIETWLATASLLLASTVSDAIKQSLYKTPNYVTEERSQ
jgi:hypothetical protein